MAERPASDPLTTSKEKQMRSVFKVLAPVCVMALLIVALVPKTTHGQAQVVPGYEGPIFAADFAHWTGRVVQGPAAGTTGSYTITMNRGYEVNTRTVNFVPYSLTTPITVGVGSTQETVTPTAVSGCAVSSQVGTASTCQITATFTFTHGVGTPVVTGDYGLQEAIRFLQPGGGQVMVDQQWYGMGATGATITATTVWNNVAVMDVSNGTRNWNPTATGAFVAPPTLPAINIAGQAACDTTHQMCSDANVAGSASWGGTVFACWAYVDIMGNEGPCSATTSWTSVASKAIDLGIPAASPGAVGAVPYLSLSGGTYILAYQIPVTATVCTMTKLETITPACAVTNTTYNQVGSTFGAGGLFTTGGAQITTYPVSTAELYTDLATTAQTLAGQHALTNSSVTYSYAPGSRVGACGASSSNIVGLASASAISGSSATTVPQPIASWTIPASCFNYIGAEFKVSGKFTYTDGGSGTSTLLTVAWDSNGTNVASVAKPLCVMNDTFTSVAGVDNGNYVCTVRILTTGATGTALVNGSSMANIAAGATTLLRNAVDSAVAASGTLNLTTNARITVFFEAVGATSNPGAQGLEATLEYIN
jgi:hypothetical protein